MTADQIKKVSLELGGKNPAIVFGDADIDKGKDITRLFGTLPFYFEGRLLGRI